MKHTHYFLTMEGKNGKDVYIDYSRLNGFKFVPKNKIRYDGVTVSEMVIINPSFIECVLKKKIKRKLDTYLQYIVQVLEDTDSYGNLTVKNRIIFYLEYILDCLNIMEEDTSYTSFTKQIKPTVDSIKNLLKDAKRNKIATQLEQKLKIFLNEFSILLEDKKHFDLETVRTTFIMYIGQMFQILMTSDEEDDGIVEIALNDLERYRRVIINRYQMFLDKHYVDLLLKKIEVLERELRLKQVYKEPVYEIEEEELEETKGKSR